MNKNKIKEVDTKTFAGIDSISSIKKDPRILKKINSASIKYFLIYLF